MRCPKCGYITFDQPESCGSCDADLTKTAENLRGTGVAATPGFFLQPVFESPNDQEETAETENSEAVLAAALESFPAAESFPELMSAVTDEEDMSGPDLSLDDAPQLNIDQEGPIPAADEDKISAVDLDNDIDFSLDSVDSKSLATTHDMDDAASMREDHAPPGGSGLSLELEDFSPSAPASAGNLPDSAQRNDFSREDEPADMDLVDLADLFDDIADDPETPAAAPASGEILELELELEKE